MERAILHCDLNNFYASVETVVSPELRGKAIAICGRTEDRHGIVLAKSEAAKKCGVKTGDVIWQAKGKCPNVLVFPPRFSEYIKYSRAVKSIYGRYTDMIEPFGIDECWLDVSGSTRLFGSPETIADDVREAVKKEIIGVDELIAEGNVGLLEAISVIEENKKNYVDAAGKPVFESIDGTIYMEVTNSIESLLDSMTSDKDWESAVLARTNLLNEAAKYMTEEMGRVPTKEELSEYTKIPVDEIRGIMGLSKDTQRIADTTAVRYRK